jgi:hypothetical protein
MSSPRTPAQKVDAAQVPADVSPPAQAAQTRKKRQPLASEPRARARPPTPKGAWEEAYFKSLHSKPRPTSVAVDVGIDYATVWRRRRDDPDFAKKEAAALAVGYETLKDEAMRRGTDGVVEERYNAAGVLVSKRIVFSDTLLLASLRYLETGSWRERTVVETPADEFASLTREQRKAKLDAAKANRAKPL